MGGSKRRGLNWRRSRRPKPPQQPARARPRLPNALRSGWGLAVTLFIGVAAVAGGAVAVTNAIQGSNRAHHAPLEVRFVSASVVRPEITWLDYKARQADPPAAQVTTHAPSDPPASIAKTLRP